MTSQVVTADVVTQEDKPVDREKKCPLLLRVFLSLTGRHNNCNDYSRNDCPPNELQVYTWTDATLKEITGLVKEVNPESRRKGTFFDFALVYPDPRTPAYRMRDIGSTCSGSKGPDDAKTLAEARFQIGDYLDIAIQTPNDRMGDRRPPPNRRNEGFAGRRDDSFAARRDDGFAGRRDDGFNMRRDDGFNPRRDDGFNPRRDDGFNPRRDDGFGGRRDDRRDRPY